MARHKRVAWGRRWLLLAGVAMAAAIAGFSWTMRFVIGSSVTPDPETPPYEAFTESHRSTERMAAAIPSPTAPPPEAFDPSPTSGAAAVAANPRVLLPDRTPGPRHPARENLSERDRRALDEVLDRAQARARGQ